MELVAKKAKLDISELEFSHPNFAWDVDSTMGYMDRSYDARFSSWVRSPENILLITYHLRRITPDYELRRVAHGIRWITQNWPVEAVTELLLGAASQQPMDWQGRLVNAVTADWPLLPNTVRVFLKFLRDRTPCEAATFCRSASEDWDDEAVGELVNHVGTKLQWTDVYFREFVVHFVLQGKGAKDQNTRVRSMCLLLHTRFACSLSMCKETPIPHTGGACQCHCGRGRQSPVSSSHTNSMYARARASHKEHLLRRRFNSVSNESAGVASTAATQGGS